MGTTSNHLTIERAAIRPASLSIRKRHGRAVNAVASYLRGKLRVPNVYLSPSNTALGSVDVLAADSAGSGDIHAVEVKILSAPPTKSLLKKMIDQMMAVPVNFKYLAIVPEHAAELVDRMHSETFSPDGIGRLGLLTIVEHDNQPPTIELAVAPERFRIPIGEMAKVERYLSKAKPDIYVRV